MSKPERFTNATGAPVPDNTNILTAGRRGPALLQDIWLIEKLAYFGSLVIPGVHNYLIFQANKAYPDRSRWIRWNKCLTFRMP